MSSDQSTTTTTTTPHPNEKTPPVKEDVATEEEESFEQVEHEHTKDEKQPSIAENTPPKEDQSLLTVPVVVETKDDTKTKNEATKDEHSKQPCQELFRKNQQLLAKMVAAFQSMVERV